MHIYWFLVLMTLAVSLLRGIPFVMAQNNDNTVKGVGIILAVASHFMVAFIVMLVFNRTAEYLSIAVNIPYWVSFFSIMFWTTITQTLTAPK